VNQQMAAISLGNNNNRSSHLHPPTPRPQINSPHSHPAQETTPTKFFSYFPNNKTYKNIIPLFVILPANHCNQILIQIHSTFVQNSFFLSRSLSYLRFTQNVERRLCGNQLILIGISSSLRSATLLSPFTSSPSLMI
jgi:hypothetical protein